ncbi:MAG: sugar transferase [Sphingomonas sp.]
MSKPDHRPGEPISGERDRLPAPGEAARSATKRAVDLGVASVTLAFFLPVLLLAALGVRLSGPGPVFVRQRHTGFGGRPFDLLRFRTTVDCHGRASAVGTVLGATGVAALPQLLNVLRGDMSLVGPQPHTATDDRHYGPMIADYRARLSVRPGLTGLAQITIGDGSGGFSAIARRIRADRDYVERWSLARDLRILLLTLPHLLAETRPA